MGRIVRQSHRWLGILFTATVVANFVAMTLGESPVALIYAPLFPLALMICSGPYLFALPYRGRRKSPDMVE
jgi:hypothetical protein